jgi:DNA-binding transcriptional regulator YiaG
MAKRKSANNPPRSFGSELIEALTEVHDALRHNNHAKLDVRTVQIPHPSPYDAKAVRALRDQLGVSQALFAQIVGVSKKLVEHWESNVRKPSPMARRLMDAIARDPKGFYRRMHQSAA